MPLLTPIEPEDASEELQRIYEGGAKRLGFVLNNWKYMGHSPRMLRAYLQFSGVFLNPEVLPKRVLELGLLKCIYLNHCDY
ncbi:MAG: hypothetical protein CUN54_07675 [Phototrophicales bacterium]|nr:MAG: hypothetical protein CUN54_07675 [Phototrophicales bacterium]